MSTSETEGEKVSRRRMLRWLGFSAIGAAIFLGTYSVARGALPGRSQESPGKDSIQGGSAGASAISSTIQGGNAGALLTVKVVYFGMPQTFGNDEKTDYFVLQSPAYYRDLLNDVLQKYPSLSAMLPTMMVIIDGLSADLGTALKDGDEVDFLPAMAGG